MAKKFVKCAFSVMGNTFGSRWWRSGGRGEENMEKPNIINNFLTQKQVINNIKKYVDSFKCSSRLVTYESMLI